MPKSHGGRRSRSPAVNGEAAAAEQSQQPQPVAAGTLRLFTVHSSGAGSDDSWMTTVAAASTSSKNPRWLATREKEAQSEAIRDKMIALIDELEAEEASDQPALKKAWLRDKKLELRRISFKQPDDIIAGEANFRKARRKLREAKRRKPGGGDAEAGDDGEDDDDEEAAGGDEGDASSDEEAGRAGETKTKRRWTVAGADRRSAGRRDRGESGDDEAEYNDGQVFNLSPSGRMSRPNPRAPAEEAIGQEAPKWRAPLKNMSKVMRFPLESGFKLGRMIRKRREKSKAANADSDGDIGEGDGNGDWVDRVHSPAGNRRTTSGGRQPRRRPSLLSSSISGGGREDIIAVVGDSDDAADEGRRHRGDGKGSGERERESDSSIADIPVLQVSVGKKLRDRLAIRRPRRGGGEEGDEGDGEGSDDEKKAKKREKKEKEKKAKAKKEEEKADEKKKQQQKKGKKKKKGDEDSEEEDSKVAPVVAKRIGSSMDSDPVQFVELED